MKIIHYVLTALFILFVTTTIVAQTETKKGTAEKNSTKSGWDDILKQPNDDYEEVVLGECVSGDCENGHGKREKYNETFEGNYKNGLLNGQGTHIKLNGEITIAIEGITKIKYVGNWAENKKVGRGVETKYDVNDKITYKYVGAWDNNKKNGAGKEYVNGGLVYDGKFKNGFRFKDIGCITGDCENGYGVFIYPNKNKYIGEFKNGLKNGFGIEVDPKGTYVYGNWKDNREDGYIRIFNKNNEIMFAVEIKDGKPLKKLDKNGVEIGCLVGDCENGFGHYLFENGDKYVGEWKDGSPHGYATYFWANNSKYIGEFYEGQIQGYGWEYDVAGQLFREGKWFGGSYLIDSDELKEEGICTFGNCRSGFGIFTIELESGWKSGYKEYKNEFDFKYEGIWLYELKNEVGFMEDKHGNTYVGQFKGGYYEGQGVATFANGDMYNGSFHDGAMNGFGTMIYADGSKYVGEWSFNDKEGQGKDYDENGKLIYSGEFYNGERDD